MIHLFSVCVMLNDPKRKNIHKKPLTLIFWIMPIVSIVTSGFTYAAALGSDMDINLIISILVGVLFIILGNYMPKLQQNYTVGIKLPWTLNSTENWNRTHRLGGKLFIAGGVLIAVSGFLSPLFGETAGLIILITITLVCVVIPMGYSFWLFRKGI